MNVVIEQVTDPMTIHNIQSGLSTMDRATMAACIKNSNEVWIGLVDGKVACTWGISLPTLLSDQAYLWLWTTDLVKEHPFVFIRRAQIVVERLSKEYNIVGHCLVGATNSIRWLKWLDAKFGEPDGDLIPFQIRKKHG
jgi:hypothetical protein